MTKQKSTKRALLLSALSLLMCVSMLIGSTFAWFTDSVTSAGNTIQSGTLDVDLVDADGKSLEGEVIEFVTADDRTQDQILWEPGCTYEIEPVFVKNNGNLALKYEIVINGITGDAKLLEAIEWTVTVNGTTTALADLKGHLLAGETSDAIVLSGHMKEEAGNEYQGLTVDGISISVFATQYTYENDSFDDQYDDIALVNTAAELKEALEAGKNTMLTSDIAIDFEDSYIIVPADADVILDMNGYDIAATTAKTDYTQCVITVRGKMNVIGNGIASITTGTLNAWSYRSAVFSVEANGELTLNEGVTIVNEGDFDMAFGVDVLSGSGSPVLNINGATIVSPYTGVRLFNNSDTKTTTVNYNTGVVYGATRDIWAQKASSKALPENAIVNIADGITYETTTQESGGVIYQMEQDATYVFDAAELLEILATESDGTTVYLAAGTYDGISLTNPANYKVKNLTIIGLDGAIINGINLNNWAPVEQSFVVDGLTIKNVTFTKGLLLSTRVMSNVTVEDCVFLNDACINQNDGSEKLTNLVVKNCSFEGDKNGNTTALMLENTENVTVTGCSFKNIDHNVLQAGKLNGTVLFDNNTVNGTGSRVFRLVTVNADVTVSNNTIISDGDEYGELAKASSPITITFTNNTWNGKSDAEVANRMNNINGVKIVYTAAELSTAIVAGGKVVLGNDITVDKWIMFSETKTIGNGKIITVEMNGLTIDGNGHTLTVNSIESAGNGNLLFDDASNLNISNLTIKKNCAGGAIGLKSGVISNVNFVGGGYGIHPGAGEITVENCTFATADGDALYFEQERDNLTVTGCTFNQLDGENVILLRGDVKFTNNTVNSGRTVNIVSGSPVVTGNNFNNVRLKVYSAATATVSGNTINNLEFETATYSSTFADNTLSTEAQAALNSVTKN